MNYIKVVTILILLIYSFKVRSYILRRPCTLFGDFSIQQHNKYMNTPVILNISNIEYDTCLLHCVQTTHCTSINHETSTKYCELLNQYLGVPGYRTGWIFHTTSYLDPLNIGGYCSEYKPCSPYHRCTDACTPQKYECIHLTNLAVGSLATVSSQYKGGYAAPASRCIDQNFVSLCHSNQEALPWYKVDLRKPHRIAIIRITTRDETSGLLHRISNYQIRVGNSASMSQNILFGRTNQKKQHVTYSNFDKIFQGRYVSLQDTDGTLDFLDFAEIEIFGIKSSEFNNL